MFFQILVHQQFKYQSDLNGIYLCEYNQLMEGKQIDHY